MNAFIYDIRRVPASIYSLYELLNDTIYCYIDTQFALSRNNILYFKYRISYIFCILVCPTLYLSTINNNNL